MRTWFGTPLLGLALLIIPGLEPARGSSEPLEPALELWTIRPDQQWQGVIDLFEGTQARHPAGALAAWKQATPMGEPRNLGKAVEAAIASLNPQMAQELRILDGTRVTVAFDAEGKLHWWARFPEEDGTIAALATALVLTDGQREPALGLVPVDRLGPPGAPVLAEVGGTVLLAASREDLNHALRQAEPAPVLAPMLATGWRLRLDPDRLARAESVPTRQAAEALLAVECRSVEALGGLEGETLAVVLNGQYDAPPQFGTRLDPSWLEWLPSEGLVAAFALPIDPNRETWDQFFKLFDRVERTDPERAEVVPVQVRLNLLGLAVGVQPDRDLWPCLVGVSACATVDEDGDLSGILLALHGLDEAAAERVASRVVTPLLRLSGHPLQVARQGSTVLVAWGETILEKSKQAKRHPEQSVSALVPELGLPSVQRFGLVWPGRVPGLVPNGSPWKSALADAPPVLWQGWNEGRATRDEIRWTGWRGTVDRLLTHLALEP